MSLSPEQREMLLNTSRPVLATVMPILAFRGEVLINRLADKGLSFGAFMGLRSFEVQRALYAQGRETLATVNGYRSAANLPALRVDAENYIVTYKRIGFHNYGLALDMVEDGNAERAGIQWSWKCTKNYLVIGPIATNLGLEYGGFWKSFKDYPHIQLTGGITIEECGRLYTQGGLQSVWDAVVVRLGPPQKQGVI